MAKQFYTRCSACNAKLGVPRVKRPMTTDLGLNSVGEGVRTEGFPKGDEEDLCNTCVGWITGVNAHVNPQWSYNYSPVTLKEVEGLDFGDIDEVNRAEAVYQGWCDD